MHVERRVETRGRSRLRTGDKVRINSALIPRLAAAARGENATNERGHLACLAKPATLKLH